MPKGEMADAIPPDIKSYCDKTYSEAKAKGVSFVSEMSDIGRLLSETPRCAVRDIPFFNSKGQGGSENTPNLVRFVAHTNLCAAFSRTARTMRQDASPHQLQRLTDFIEEAERPAKRIRKTAVAS